jgi:hypothetical protein
MEFLLDLSVRPPSNYATSLVCHVVLLPFSFTLPLSSITRFESRIFLSSEDSCGDARTDDLPGQFHLVAGIPIMMLPSPAIPEKLISSHQMREGHAGRWDIDSSAVSIDEDMRNGPRYQFAEKRGNRRVQFCRKCCEE